MPARTAEGVFGGRILDTVLAEVFTETLMKDFDFTDISEVLVELGGAGPPVQGNGDTATGYQEGDLNDFKNFSIRGLTASNQRRDGFVRSDGTTLDNFDVDSVEAVHGPQSLLYGAGDAGGVVNFVSKRANFRKKHARLGVSVNERESLRYSADINYGLKNLAIRAVYMNEDTNYYRYLTGRESEGYFAALAFRPLKSVVLRAQYRNLTRHEINARGAAVYGPSGSSRSLRLHLYKLLDGTATEAERANYGDFWTWKNVDSSFGAQSSRHFEHEYKDVSADIIVSQNVEFQIRWGKDDRLNNAIVPYGADNDSGDDESAIAVLHADRGANPYETIDPYNGFAIKTQPRGEPYYTGQQGPRIQGNFKFNIGKFSRHQLGVAVQVLDGYIKRVARRFYEVDDAGNIIQNATQIATIGGGRNQIPIAYLPVFSESLYPGNDADWPTNSLTDSATGKHYRLVDVMNPGWAPVTPDNPLGLNGVDSDHTLNSKWYSHMETREEALLASLYSEWFKGKIDTMLGVREERFQIDWLSHAQRRVERLPVLTTGAVWHIIGKLRGFANYSTNANIPSSPDQIDIHNRLLPFGEGHSWEAGVKFDFFNRRISGAATYYDATVENIPRTLTSDERNAVDPDSGVNGVRNGGNKFSGSLNSRGWGLSLNARPFSGWELRLNYTHADGAEREDIYLRTLYNDQFNVMPDGNTVAVRNAANSLSPHMVEDPANPGAQIPLTIDMMKAAGPYHANVNATSGRITNAADLGLDTPGVGTGVTGLPIEQHQLGFAAPNGGNVLVRKSGDKNTGYATNFVSLVNTYRFRSGLLRGLSLGCTASWQIQRRGFYYTDNADGGARKLFYYPDHFDMRAFISYRFKIMKKYSLSLRASTTNLLDRQEVIRIPNQNTGVLRYARQDYAPRYCSFTAALEF
ncbi:MAG: TonB-dependent receptor plug domain-containing protein [Opitutaceae bacterium]|jgi:outer membrane receptor protein involved in Fe transport|nr:TonB-dependent receptor plug domain-containing protein [Opitutaceae bacterium]